MKWPVAVLNKNVEIQLRCLAGGADKPDGVQ